MIFKKRTNAVTWQEILEGCLRREAKAQRQLFERYANFAKNTCLRYAQNEVEAEEMVSDGFLKVFDKIEKYDPAQPFEGWLKRLMVNTAIDYFRRNTHKISWVDVEDASQVPWVDSNYKDEYLMTITADEIMVFVQRLPMSYRTVFSLSVVEGYNHNEIAEMLGISESASRSNLSKAKAKLQSWISAYVVQQDEITHKHE
ncbi:RNA polymerase sigma factor [Runella sp. SP2]|uniref:RNA polymerase sigma factor n=1 Tax=Runella sp. SP2 TaxID=2268026 RepID=UPI000F089E54|nr:sigma-70 family RNA polymerase sigma factor [Runella sp. SP2]AYQ31737.1 sigma-70 family RNA polymerase sigma factor [Runella sp. SP2]